MGKTTHLIYKLYPGAIWHLSLCYVGELGEFFASVLGIFFIKCRSHLIDYMGAGNVIFCYDLIRHKNGQQG